MVLVLFLVSFMCLLIRVQHELSAKSLVRDIIAKSEFSFTLFKPCISSLRGAYIREPNDNGCCGTDQVRKFKSLVGLKALSMQSIYCQKLPVYRLCIKIPC